MLKWMAHIEFIVNGLSKNEILYGFLPLQCTVKMYI